MDSILFLFPPVNPVFYHPEKLVLQSQGHNKMPCFHLLFQACKDNKIWFTAVYSFSFFKKTFNEAGHTQKAVGND